MIVKDFEDIGELCELLILELSSHSKALVELFG